MNVVTRSNGQKRSFSTLIGVLSVFDREDLNAIYKLVMDIYQDRIPEGFDKVLWGDLIVMFNPDEQDEFWNSQHEWKVISWKLHSSSGVHTLMTDEGLVIHMLIEKKYPLKKEIVVQMLKLKLESEEESTMALELIRFIKKSWLVQDQTVLGKDYSNLLIADSLLKTIWFINAPCYDNEALASPNTNDEELSIPEQTATGKGTSNPLMAGCKDPFSLLGPSNGPAPRSMEELCQPSINGQGGPIAPIPIEAMDFRLRHHMIQQQNGVSDDALQLSVFPYSLTYHAIACHRDTINAAAGGTFMQKTPEECYKLIENMTAHHNHWDTSATRDETSRNISSTTTTESPEVVRQLEMMNKNFLEMMRQIQSVKSVDTKCETCGGPYSFTECPAVGGYIQEAAYAATGYHNSGGDLKTITTQSGVAYDGPTIPPTPLPKEVERETEMTKDKVQTISLESIAYVQPPVVQDPILDPKVSPKPNPKPSIPYPSRLNDQKLRQKANNQMLKFLQIFQRLHFDISFVDALLYMSKFASTFKSLLRIDDVDFDPEGDIRLLEKLLNEDLSPNLPPMTNDDLKQVDITMTKPSFEQPSKLELKDLPSHLEYAFLEGTDKLPVIISKRIKRRRKRRPFKGTPRAIISDRGTYFCNDQFAKVMLKYGVTHRLSTAYHPKMSGQLEVSNHSLKHILERTVGKNRASWSNKLEDALWAFRTAFKTLIGCTPYKLVYGKACRLPIELEHKAYWSLKHCNFDLKTAGDHQKVQMNELNELRDQAYENSLIYKEKTKKIHDSKIKNRVFNVGDQDCLDFKDSCARGFVHRSLDLQSLACFYMGIRYPRSY
ncbi:reverse transcriptase domain-containing protein [Tanacetum coccineum]